MQKSYKTVPLSQIKPYPNNPRINDAAAQDVAKSIEQCGYIAPIVVDEDMVILAGHTRAKALESLGKTEADIIIVSGLSDAQKRKYRLLDNKTQESATWDLDLLEQELADLDFGDLELDWGIDLDDEPTEAVEDDYDAEPPEEPRAKMGDIYQLGRHRLMCGDSTNAEDVKKLVGGVDIDIIFTDPPYNVSFNGRTGKFDVIENDDLDSESFIDFIDKTIAIIKAVNAPNYYIWCNWKFYGLLQERLDFKNCIVWAKNVFGMGNGYRHQHEFCLYNGNIDEDIKNESDLWEIPKDTNYVHPTQKPIALCARALRNHKSANNVLDLFGGSGSTLIACEQLGRTCYICEVDPKYCDVIIDRYEKFTNQKAVKIGS